MGVKGKGLPNLVERLNVFGKQPSLWMSSLLEEKGIYTDSLITHEFRPS